MCTQDDQGTKGCATAMRIHVQNHPVVPACVEAGNRREIFDHYAVIFIFTCSVLNTIVDVLDLLTICLNDMCLSCMSMVIFQPADRGYTLGSKPQSWRKMNSVPLLSKALHV
jgi:hypothetical protein